MSKVIDCKGLSCPIPVLKTKEALENIDSGKITVIVDNKASKENVKKFATKNGCTVEVEEKEGLFYLHITKGENTQTSATKKEEKEIGKTQVALIASTYVGEDKELGKILLKGFLKTFVESDAKPKKIVLINTAVKLACKGSEEEILNLLKQLEESGVEIILCGTCLNYFNLLDDLQVGSVGSAYDVVKSLTDADSVIRL
ncbi:MAG: sulfurtransferase-like selenium metabolism protein YedF [Desulfurobacteriaceae bacterium]